MKDDAKREAVYRQCLKNISGIIQESDVSEEDNGFSYVSRDPVCKNIRGAVFFDGQRIDFFIDTLLNKKRFKQASAVKQNWWKHFIKRSSETVFTFSDDPDPSGRLKNKPEKEQHEKDTYRSRADPNVENLKFGVLLVVKIPTRLPGLCAELWLAICLWILAESEQILFSLIRCRCEDEFIFCSLFYSWLILSMTLLYWVLCVVVFMWRYSIYVT